MSLAPKTPPCLALTVIIRQIDSNHQNYLGRAVVFYFCILYFPKNTNSTLCIFLYFCIFQKMQIPHFAFFLYFCILYFICIFFVLFLYYFCIFWNLHFLENTKIQKNAKCGICIFWKIQKYKIQKIAKVVFF